MSTTLLYKVWLLLRQLVSRVLIMTNCCLMMWLILRPSLQCWWHLSSYITYCTAISCKAKPYTIWLQIFVRQYFCEFCNTLYITNKLALIILVLYRCSPASYMNISSQCRRAPHHHQIENFPVATSRGGQYTDYLVISQYVLGTD